MDKRDDFISDEEWASRTLCMDESCIGVVGPDGRCKECGLLYDPGHEPEQLFPEDDSIHNDVEPLVDQETEEEGTDLFSDEEWANRTLCMDESCIGVVGPDGRCKECGLVYKKE